MNITILPKTILGKWSLGTILVGILLYMIFFIVVRLGYRSGVNVPASPTILLFISAIASMVIGIISVIITESTKLFTIIDLFSEALDD